MHLLELLIHYEEAYNLQYMFVLDKPVPVVYLWSDVSSNELSAIISKTRGKRGDP